MENKLEECGASWRPNSILHSLNGHVRHRGGSVGGGDDGGVAVRPCEERRVCAWSV